MTGKDTSPQPQDPLDAAFAEFRDAWIDGERPDPDEFCRAHAEYGQALRSRIDNFLFVADALRSAPAESEPARGETAGAGAEVETPSDAGATEAVLSGRILGDFRVIREIGRGGMGRVWEAEQISLHRRVALKVLSPHLSFSADAVRKYHREAEAGGRQRHPGIVAIYAVGEAEGVHYIAQELVEEGVTLADKLERLRSEGVGPGYFRLVAQLVANVADALQHAHDSGVIHRDVKPSNILLTPSGVPKVTDFGLAKIEDALTLSRSGVLAGTPYYMSPEQIAAGRVRIDHRTDIFSLGVTLYEMLTLERPFEGETAFATLKKIKLCDPRHPCRANARVPRDLAVICLKAMEKKPEKRYATMREFAEDLRRFLSGDVTVARPSGPFARACKKIRKNPVPVAAVGVAVVALGTLGMMLAQLAHERERSRQLETSVTEAGEVASKSGEEAVQERAEREKQQRIAEAARLAALSSSKLAVNPGQALLIAIEAAQRHSTPQTNDALLQSLEACRELRTLVHPDAVNGAEFSSDGRLVVTACRDRAVRILDVETGAEVAVLEGHESSVVCARFSSDGERVVSASQDGTARIWNVVRRETMATLRDRDAVLSASFDREGKRVVTSSLSGTARIWDARTGVVLATLEGHEAAVLTASFDHDGRRVVTASKDGTARVWDATKGTLLVVLTADAHTVYGASFGPADGKIVTAGEDGSARIWDAETGEEMVVLPGPGGPVFSACFSPDGRRVLTASGDRTARIWDVATGNTVIVLKGHEHPVRMTASFSSDARWVVTASEDKTARIWDAEEAKPLVTILQHEDSVESACFDRGGVRVLTGCADGTARIWETATGKEVLVLRGHGAPVSSACYDPSGSRVLTISEDETARIWDATTGNQLGVLTGRDAPAGRGCFSPDGRKVLTSSDAQAAQIWDVDTGEAISVPYAFRVGFAGFSPDAGRMVIASQMLALILDTATSRSVAVLKGHEDLVTMAAFSPDGQRVVTASRDQSAWIWRAATGARLLALRGHEGSVTAAWFSRDGKLLGTASEDRTARLWSATTGEALAVLEGHAAPLTDIRFSPGGESVVTASCDGTAMIWPADPLSLALQRRPRELTLKEKELLGILNQDELEAKQLVEKLHRELILSKEVVAYLQADRSLRDEIRQAALAFAGSKSDGLLEMILQGYALLRRGETLASYQEALRLAEAAIRLAAAIPEEQGETRVFLAIAQYRLGMYQDALKTLGEPSVVTEIEGARSATPPFDAVVIALAQHGLGHGEEARAALARARALAHEYAWATNPVFEEFFREAEELIEGRAPAGEK
ncbi:MAG: protein kinase [Planctomycetota bacterium]